MENPRLAGEGSLVRHFVQENESVRIGIAQHDFTHPYTSTHRNDAGIRDGRGTGGDRLRQEGIEIVHFETEVGGTDVDDMTIKQGFLAILKLDQLQIDS